jgi:hypothetical protein
LIEVSTRISLAEKDQHPRVELDARWRRSRVPRRACCSRDNRELDLLALQAIGVSTTQAAAAVSRTTANGEKEQLEEVFAHQSGAADRLRGWEVRTNFDWPYNSRKLAWLNSAAADPVRVPPAGGSLPTAAPRQTTSRPALNN